MTGNVNIYHREEIIRGMDDQDRRNSGTLTAFVHTCRGNGGQPHSQLEKGFSELPHKRDLATPGEMRQHQQWQVRELYQISRLVHKARLQTHALMIKIVETQEL